MTSSFISRTKCWAHNPETMGIEGGGGGGGGGREWLQPEIIVVLTHRFLSQAAFLNHWVSSVECCILCVSMVQWIGALMIDSLQKSTKRQFDKRDGIWWGVGLHASKKWVFCCRVFSVLVAICYDSLFLLFVFWYSFYKMQEPVLNSFTQ